MQQTLTSERLTLRPFVPQDADAVVAALDDAETCRGLTVVPCPHTKQDADQFISKGAVHAVLTDGFAAVAVLRKLGFAVVGNTKLHIRSRGIAVPAKSVHLTRTQRDAQT